MATNFDDDEFNKKFNSIWRNDGVPIYKVSGHTIIVKKESKCDCDSLEEVIDKYNWWR
jgi:hypothetical protein